LLAVCLQVDTLGFPVSVLKGHTAAVTLIQFHPHLHQVLLTASFDGTCCLWDATEGGTPPLILSAAPELFAAQHQRLARRAAVGADIAAAAATAGARVAAGGDAAGGRHGGLASEAQQVLPQEQAEHLSGSDADEDGQVGF
jgi:PH-interacting protein